MVFGFKKGQRKAVLRRKGGSKPENAACWVELGTCQCLVFLENTPSEDSRVRRKPLKPTINYNRKLFMTPINGL